MCLNLPREEATMVTRHKNRFTETSIDNIYSGDCVLPKMNTDICWNDSETKHVRAQVSLVEKRGESQLKGAGMSRFEHCTMTAIQKGKDSLCSGLNAAFISAYSLIRKVFKYLSTQCKYVKLTRMTVYKHSVSAKCQKRYCSYLHCAITPF